MLHTHTGTERGRRRAACTEHNEANGNGNIKYCNKLAFVPAAHRVADRPEGEGGAGGGERDRERGNRTTAC